MSLLNLLAAAEPAGSIPQTFGLDPLAIGLQVIGFSIFALVLWVVLLKPLLRTMDERTKTISDGLQYAEEMKHKLVESERRQAEAFKAAQLEAGRIVDEARQAAKGLTDRAAAEAAARTEELLRKGREAIELEREKTLAEVRREVARLVVDTTGRVLKQDLTDQDRRRFNAAAARELSLN